MASRRGILSNNYSERFCKEYSAAPLGYFQAYYQELPKNPNLPGIKLPRYVQTVTKPVSLDVAAVNMGKLLHKNNHLAASFVLDQMVEQVTPYVPPTVSITPSIGRLSSQSNHISLANIVGSSRGLQLATQVSGSRTPTPSTHGQSEIEYQYSSESEPSSGSPPHSNLSSVSESDHDLELGGPAYRQTAQAQERAEVAASTDAFSNFVRESDELFQEIDFDRMSTPRRTLTRSITFANRTPEQRQAQIERRTHRRMLESARQADEVNTANEANPRFPISRYSDGTMSGGPSRLY